MFQDYYEDFTTGAGARAIRPLEYQSAVLMFKEEVNISQLIVAFQYDADLDGYQTATGERFDGSRYIEIEVGLNFFDYETKTKTVVDTKTAIVPDGKTVDPLGDEDLQKLFVPNPHADIHHLVEHCLSADDWETIFKQTFPIGIFVDGASDKEEYVLKTNKFLHLNKITHHIEQEIDSNGDAGILFISRFQYINELIISLFLSLDMSDIHFPSNTSIELTCYYAFYNKNFIKNGKFYNISIENKRLATINKILTN